MQPSSSMKTNVDSESDEHFLEKRNIKSDCSKKTNVGSESDECSSEKSDDQNDTKPSNEWSRYLYYDVSTVSTSVPYKLRENTSSYFAFGQGFFWLLMEDLEKKLLELGVDRIVLGVIPGIVSIRAHALHNQTKTHQIRFLCMCIHYSFDIHSTPNPNTLFPL
ncbi:hypothetical protein L2E82_06770 [Cichorium intybus]|uniref:Uncharacterized protein n=1 Tax=Cichorium intybus TaxID=13427 RepID=A0ACB9HAG0_CICIN|nr:hypothetical protein L2E82_06770 [Cichorium intybus]